ncbi:hypothetical protein N7466_005008 [Penicillium verhagenii]|uniref:uncharacterized protein n=1 Tax=Penicillium verhagenii TaxID=1562060 RepID=UPI0025458DCB|nr:uncharacterized protein N7466_005008 [Penicillium verhagenii]KAJ5935461.1 hypothetical protein N7466_005008 [Penicillium verhagenii]
MKFLLLPLCTLAASAAVYVRDVEDADREYVVTIAFANEKTGYNFLVNTPADHREHHIHSLFHGFPVGSSTMATSAQLIGTLTPDTACVITDNGIELAVLDTKHTFAWISEKGHHDSPVDVDRLSIKCLA